MLSPRRRHERKASTSKGEEEGPYASEDGIDLAPVDLHSVQPASLTPSRSRSGHGAELTAVETQSTVHLPSWEESETLEIILRRQRKLGTGVKTIVAPSRFSTPALDETIEFAGWGSTSTLKLTAEELAEAKLRIEAEKALHVQLSHLAAASIPSMGVMGSVFYSLPAVVTVTGSLSPISLFVATLLLFFIRPIMEELASAFPVPGSAYAYLLNSTTRSTALMGAAVYLLDYCLNSLQASASAAAYLAGEVSLPFDQAWLTVTILIGAALAGCLGAKEGARVTLVIAAFHLAVMAALMLACAVAWGRTGSSIIHDNWVADVGGASSSTIARQLFDGICLGLLAISGFECSPEYAPMCRRGQYRKMLRDLHWSAILLIGPMMLFVLALLPSATILGGYNVLSVLAEQVGGRPLRILIVIDALLILCGGCLTGALSACSLVYRLAHDRVLPTVLTRRLPLTHAPWVIQIAFTVLCIIIYASTGASVVVIGKIFSISLLVVLALYPVSAIMLKYNRGRLPRDPKASLSLVLFCLALLIVIFAGNVALDPTTLAYFAPYVIVLIGAMLLFKEGLNVLRIVYWVYDGSAKLRSNRFTRRWGSAIIRTMRRMRKRPVICFVKTDEINLLLRLVLYVQRNEPSSHLKLVHLFDAGDKTPRDFQAFSQILDEAFPGITIDMVWVQGSFDPLHVEAICHKLQVVRSSAFVSAFGEAFPYNIADLGVRIISL